jgi:hypothetical protein
MPKPGAAELDGAPFRLVRESPTKERPFRLTCRKLVFGVKMGDVRVRPAPGGNETLDMIHEILPSDVEFARGMLHSSHTDAEILACLAARGIQATQAAALVNDLRHGRQPSAQLPFEPARTFHPPIAGAQTVPEPRPAPRHHAHRKSHQPKGIPWWFVVLVLIFVLALGYILFETGRTISTDSANPEKQVIPSPPGK